MKRLAGFQKGVNLGGWLSQCPCYEKEHFDTFIREEDIKRIAQWGMDHVRLPIDFDVIETPEGESRESGLRHIDDCVRWCRAYHLNIVLDLHKTKGYMFDEKAVPDADLFFEDVSLQDRFYDTWRRLIARYGKDKDIMVYELLNEVVNAKYADKWNEIAGRAIDVIREAEPSARIMYGGVCHNDVSSIPKLLPPKDDNIFFTFHCYDPLCFTHQRAHWVENTDYELSYPGQLEEYREKSSHLQQEKGGHIFTTKVNDLCSDYFRESFSEALEIAEQYQVPLYCGEFGVIDRAPAEDSLRWLEDLVAVLCENGIGKAIWSYKCMNFGISDMQDASVLEKILKLITKDE